VYWPCATVKIEIVQYQLAAANIFMAIAGKEQRTFWVFLLLHLSETMARIDIVYSV